MYVKSSVIILSVLLFLAGPFPCRAQADKAEQTKAAKQTKELNFAGTPYVYTGPDTGFGVGFSIIFRDLFNTEGRDATFSASYTQTRYQNLSVKWQEPYFLSKHGRLNLSIGYDNKPAMRFYGLGNDTRRNRDSNWAWVKYNFSPEYVYRWPATKYGIVGLRTRIAFNDVDPQNGDLERDKEDKYTRKIKEVHPKFFRSFNFEHAKLINAGFTLYLDDRVDRFPLGGGREEVVWPLKGTYQQISYDRFDKAIGSDFTFNQFTADLRQYLPLFSEDTILVLREKAIITQGNIPFYMMPSYGGGNDLRGFYAYRFIDKNATQFNVELRQGFFPDAELPVAGGIIKLKYPSIVLFWDEARVYDDYTEIPDHLFEDYHYTWGYGFRFVVTPSVVIRLEWGYSNEQVTFAANAGLPF